MKIKLLRQLYTMSCHAFKGFLIQCICFTFLFAESGKAQKSIEEVYLTIQMDDVKVKQVFSQIEKKTPFSFAYPNNVIEGSSKISLDFENESLANLLRYVSKNSELGFKRIGETIHVNVRSEQESELIESILADVDISGKITDENNQGLPGASVVQKGTTNGVTTDLEGNYKLTVSETSLITISFVGYITQEVVVGNRSVIDLQMEIDATQLEELVVIGYGVQKKSDLTGSVASLSAEKLNSQPITSLEQGLQGRIAGVHVTNNSSAPGGGMSIKIRGVTSILNGSEPLYVIDGFPVTGQSQFSTSAGRGIEGTTGANYTVNQNPLAALNPSDIESIEVLKDASAAAIYGVRGANGVILITTKRGTKGAPKVSYTGYTGVQSIAKKIEVMNAQEFQDINNLQASNSGKQPVFTGSPANDMDWQDLIFRDALIQNHQISVNGGTDAVQYLVSGSFFDQEGVIKGSEFERYSFRVNLDINASEKLKFGNSLNVSRTINNAANVEGESKDGITSVALMMSPILPIYQPDGTYSSNRFVDVPDADGRFNPIAFLNEFSDNNVITRLLGNFYGEYLFTKDLKFRSTIGADLENRDRHVYQTSRFNNENPLNSANVSSVNRTSLLNENTLNYNKNIGDHSISALVGLTAQKEMEEYRGINSRGFASDATGSYDLGAGSQVPIVGSSYADFSILSFLGRVNYNYQDRFLITVTGRRDGSSKFAEGNKWAFFPSLAGAWKISNEDFMSSATDVISALKLRVGYGKVGNQELAPYSSLSLLQSSNYNFGDGSVVNGFSPLRVAVPDLTWEITSQTNIGLDASFLQNRFNVSFDYYNKKTKDMLLEVVLPETSGITRPSVQNLGEMENVGWEMSADGVIINNNDFKWDLGFNLSSNRNKITYLGDPDKVGDLSFLTVQPTFNGGGARSLIEVGYPIGSFIGYKYDGLYRNQAEADAGQALRLGVIPGMRRDVDENGDGVLDADERGVIGSAFPDLLYGFSSSVSYKAFQLRVFFQGQKGGKVYNMMRAVSSEIIRGQNLVKERSDVWTPSNTDAVWPILRTDLPPVGGAGDGVDFFLEDASYLRMREITLTYNLPQDLIGGMNGSVYITGQNLLTITDYKGYNPDINGRSNIRGTYGIDVSSYPLAKTILLGLKLNF